MIKGFMMLAATIPDELRIGETKVELTDDIGAVIDKEWEKALQKLRDAGEITDREYEAMRRNESG